MDSGFDFLEYVAETVLVIDADYKILRITSHYLDLLGRRESEVIGRNFLKLDDCFKVKGRDGSPLPLDESPIARAIRGERVVNYVFRLECPRGEIEFLNSAAPIMDEETGTVVAAVSSSRDVTEFRRLDRAKDEFITMASHELRTPLTLIRALAQLGLLETRNPARPLVEAATERGTTATLEQIVAQVDLMTTLVDQLLDLSRIDAGKQVLRLRVTKMAEFLEAEVGRLRIAYGTHLLALDLTGANQPWRNSYVDPQKLAQVVTNLVSNAVRYSAPGTTVTIGLRESGDPSCAAEVWVRDEGIGVPYGDREAIFDKFYRSPNAVNWDSSGLGVGLYIARSVVELHGGRIWLDQSARVGSTFRFTIPGLTAQGGESAATV